MSLPNQKAISELAKEASEHCLCQRTRKAARLVTKTYDDALRPLGLRGTQFTVLAAIARAKGGLSITELAHKMGMDRTTLSRNLAPLERDKLVRMLDQENSGRTKTVELTEPGLARFAEAEPLWRHAQDQVKAAVSGDDLATMVRGLQSVSDKLV